MNNKSPIPKICLNHLILNFYSYCIVSLYVIHLPFLCSTWVLFLLASIKIFMFFYVCFVFLAFPLEGSTQTDFLHGIMINNLISFHVSSSYFFSILYLSINFQYMVINGLKQTLGKCSSISFYRKGT